RLADFKVPVIIELVTAIPRSPVGKVLRKDLVETTPRVFPMHTIEMRVCSDVARLLRVDTGALDFRKTFSEMGIDSAAGVALQRRLEVWLGRPLPATLVWNYPTAAALSRHLSSLTAPVEPTGQSAATAPIQDAVSVNAADRSLETQASAILERIGTD